MIRQMQRSTASPAWCSAQSLAGLLVLLSALVAVAAQPFPLWQTHVEDKLLDLELSYTTNHSGHPYLQTSLEQPSDVSVWDMNVQIGTKCCASDGRVFNTISLSLKGSAEGDKPWKPSKPPKPQPLGYTKLPGFGYYRRSDHALGWSDARLACEAEDAVLAVPKSQREMDALAHVFSFNITGSANPHCIWILASDLVQKGKFVTSSGTLLSQVSSLPWRHGYPDGNPLHNCVDYCVGYGLDDNPCSNKYAYVCKVEF